MLGASLLGSSYVWALPHIIATLVCIQRFPDLVLPDLLLVDTLGPHCDTLRFLRGPHRHQQSYLAVSIPLREAPRAYVSPKRLVLGVLRPRYQTNHLHRLLARFHGKAYHPLLDHKKT